MTEARRLSPIGPWGLRFQATIILIDRFLTVSLFERFVVGIVIHCCSPLRTCVSARNGEMPNFPPACKLLAVKNHELDFLASRQKPGSTCKTVPTCLAGSCLAVCAVRLQWG